MRDGLSRLPLEERSFTSTLTVFAGYTDCIIDKRKDPL